MLMYPHNGLGTALCKAGVALTHSSGEGDKVQRLRVILCHLHRTPDFSVTAQLVHLTTMKFLVNDLQSSVFDDTWSLLGRSSATCT